MVNNPDSIFQLLKYNISNNTYKPYFCTIFAEIPLVYIKELESMHPEITAYHEAGHYIVAWFYRMPRKELSIIPEGYSLGRIMIAPDGNTLWAYSCIMIAGPIAQNMYYHLSYGSRPASFEWGSDFEDIIQIYNEIHQTDIKPPIWWDGPKQSDEDDVKAFEFFCDVGEEADRLLIEYWPILTVLARELIKKRVLTSQQADTIIWSSLVAKDVAKDFSARFPESSVDFVERFSYKISYPMSWVLVKILHLKWRFSRAKRLN